MELYKIGFWLGVRGEQTAYETVLRMLGEEGINTQALESGYQDGVKL